MWRGVLIGLAVLAGGLAVLLANGAASAGAAAEAGPELARLLRLMAIVKAAMALAALWLIDWRLRQPASLRLSALYVTAATLLATAPGLIWSLSHVALGAVLFHGGLGLLIALAYLDGG